MSSSGRRRRELRIPRNPRLSCRTSRFWSTVGSWYRGPITEQTDALSGPLSGVRQGDAPTTRCGSRSSPAASGQLVVAPHGVRVRRCRGRAGLDPESMVEGRRRPRDSHARTIPSRVFRRNLNAGACAPSSGAARLPAALPRMRVTRRRCGTAAGCRDRRRACRAEHR